MKYHVIFGHDDVIRICDGYDLTCHVICGYYVYGLTSHVTFVCRGHVMTPDAEFEVWRA